MLYFKKPVGAEFIKQTLSDQGLINLLKLNPVYFFQREDEFQDICHLGLPLVEIFSKAGLPFQKELHKNMLQICQPFPAPATPLYTLEFFCDLWHEVTSRL